MELPDFIRSFSSLVLPIGDDAVTTHAVRSDEGLVVFFSALKDVEIPPHSHKGQWGTVLEGSLELTIDGVTRTYRPGESYNIPSGVEHSAKLAAGTKALDVFEEPDRYTLKA